jgi:hypothetical protein
LFATWQVFWLGLADTFPFIEDKQWFEVSASEGNLNSRILTIDYSPFTNLTATGIAPALHRTSLLILVMV